MYLSQFTKNFLEEILVNGLLYRYIMESNITKLYMFTVGYYSYLLLVKKVTLDVLYITIVTLKSSNIT